MSHFHLLTDFISMEWWTYTILTNATWQRPSWDANSSSHSQEIPYTLWNLKVHYSVHNTLPLGPLLHQINTIQAPHPMYVFKTHFTVILQYTPVFQGVSFLEVYSSKPSVQCSSPPNMTRAPPVLILHILITQALHMWRGQQSWSQFGNFGEKKNLLLLMQIKPWHT